MLTKISRFLVYASFFFLPLTFIRVVSNLSISDLLIILTFFSLIISHSGRVFLAESVLIKNEFIVPLVIFSIGFFLSINKSIYPLESLTAYLQIIFIFVIAYPVLTAVIRDEQQIKTIAVLLIIPGVIISILMLLLKFIGLNIGIDLLAYEGWKGRFSYGGMEPNIPGRIILQNIPLLAVLAVTAKKKLTKVLPIILIVIQLLAIILTSSRSNMLTFVFALILFIYFIKKSGQTIRIDYAVYSMIVIFIILAAFYSINDEFFVKPLERYSTILNANKSASSMERIRIIDEGFSLIDQNPFVGLGFANSYLYTGVNVHNPILLAWVENGIFGIIGFVGIYAVLLLQGYKVFRNKFWSNYMMLGLTLVTLMMVFGDMFMANSYKRVLWLPALLFLAYKKNYVIQSETS